MPADLPFSGVECIGDTRVSLKFIGAGVGRTGTYSLKLAINQLGLGPCHHMEEVLINMPKQLPLWQAAVAGKPDWEALYDGYISAVDWPTAAFHRELYAAYPKAKFILTHRSVESWVESFSSTIYKLLGMRDTAPEPMRPWLEMAVGVISKTGFPPGLDHDALAAAFEAHVAAVKATIPASQLLVFQVKEGWEPLCAFLGVPAPEGPFPRTNDRSEFWDKVSAAVA
jgi:Sulfotransferase domain